MERRFVAKLAGRFDNVEDRGVSYLTDQEVSRWWERQRITRSIWQDLQERWAERSEVPLKIAYRAGRYLLVSGEEGWLQPIEEWC